MAADGRRPEGVSAGIAMNGWVVRQVIRAAGEILLTAGVVGLLFLGYLVWGTGLRAASAQRALSGELNQEWRQGPVRGDAVGASPERFDVATGQPFAFIRIPAFGRQCTPQTPLGATMVSAEGACAAYFAYGRHLELRNGERGALAP